MDAVFIASAGTVIANAIALGGLIWWLARTTTRLELHNEQVRKDLSKLEKISESMTDIAIHRNEIAFLKDTVVKLTSMFAGLRIQVERADERASQGDYR